jgi:N-acetylglutamate synthase-like GNAT family acetyltransferase
VETDQRNKGIGKALIEKAEMVVRLMKVEKLYLRTEDASAYYLRLGWNHIETTCDDFGITVDILCKTI